MTDHEICEKCSQRNGCKQAYQRMADYQGPSVLGKVLTAFAVPLLSFILMAAVFQDLTAHLMSKTLSTALSFVLAVGTTALVIIIIQVINRRFGVDR
jgi:hypothetical protein